MVLPEVRIVAATLVTFALICPFAVCQSPDQATAKPGILSFDDVEVSAALEKIGQHFGVKVLSYGKLDKKVTATLRDADIAQALTSVTSPFGYRWRRVSLAAKDGEEITGAKLYGIVTGLEKLDTAAATVENPGEKTKLTFRRNPEADPTGSPAEPGGTYKTYYLVYNPKPTITFAPAQAAKGQPAQAKAPSSPEGLMDWFSSLDPEAQSRLLGELMGSMMPGGEGAVSLSIAVGEDDESGERKAVLIRKLEPGDQGGQ